MSQLIIYHAGCWDGFCAAWLMHLRFPNAEFYPANYGDPEPHHAKVAGRDVYILDFSYPRETLVRLYELSNSLIVLDHHKTAKDELEGLPYCVFEADKSGARMTHEYIDRAIDGRRSGLGSLPHWLVLYTEDRDLWRWELTDSREVNAWLRSHPLDFLLWDSFAMISQHTAAWEMIVAEGAAILRAEQQIVDSKVQQSVTVTVESPEGSDFELWFDTWQVANATTLVSETAGALARISPVGCTWFEMPDGSRVYSLRSERGSPANVSEIAKAFGGGGHRHAAGFRWSRKEHPWEVPANAPAA